MVRFVKSLCLVLSSLPLLLVAAQMPPPIVLRLDAGSYYPGDLIELTAEMRGTDYAEFSMRLPSHPKLHFVAYAPESVRYQAGEYVQRAVWHLQPLAAGEFVLEPIQVSLRVGAENAQELTLAPLTIGVQSHAAVQISDALAAWPDAGTQTSMGGRFRVWFFMLLPVVLLTVWLLLRARHVPQSVPEVAGVSLAGLCEKLQQGQPAIELIELLLARSDLKLSAELRGALEAAAYGGRLDTDHLLRLIQSEVAS